MTRKTWRASVWGLLLVTASCGDPGVATLEDQLLEASPLGLPHSAIPPFYSFCGTVAPDYDPETYDPRTDDFCTLSFTREYERVGGELYMDEIIWVTDMGEPAADAELSPHLAAIRAQLAEGGPAVYCSFRHRVEVSPAEGVSEADAIDITYVIEEISEYCTGPYISDPILVPGFTLHETVIRSTRDDLFVVWARNLDELGHENPISFCGYDGVPDTGPGRMNYYESCEPTADDLGTCAPRCRLFSPSTNLPVCTWGDIGALPANPSLIESTWIEEYRPLFDEVFGSDG